MQALKACQSEVLRAVRLYSGLVQLATAGGLASNAWSGGHLFDLGALMVVHNPPGRHLLSEGARWSEPKHALGSQQPQLPVYRSYCTRRSHRSCARSWSGSWGTACQRRPAACRRAAGRPRGHRHRPGSPRTNPSFSIREQHRSDAGHRAGVADLAVLVRHWRHEVDAHLVFGAIRE